MYIPNYTICIIMYVMSVLTMSVSVWCECLPIILIIIILHFFIFQWNTLWDESNEPLTRIDEALTWLSMKYSDYSHMVSWYNSHCIGEAFRTKLSTLCMCMDEVFRLSTHLCNDEALRWSTLGACVSMKHSLSLNPKP